MVKKLSVIILSFILLSASSQVNKQYCYVCLGNKAYAYHKTTQCSGLKKCESRIIKVEVSTAKSKYKRKPCKRCYK